MGKKVANLVLIGALSILFWGCAEDGKQGLQGAPGESIVGPKGERGEDGKDGEDATPQSFVESGSLGVYQENAQFPGSEEVQLTCMLGESVTANKVVLRLRSKSGGLLEFEKVGEGKDFIYLPAGLEILITTKHGNGTFKAKIGANQQTKACSPL